MKLPLILALIVVLSLASAPLASGAPATAAKKTTVNVGLVEFKVQPSKKKVRRGTVKFVVRNKGRTVHNFVVLRTNRAPNKLPTAGGRAREIGRVGKTRDLRPGMRQNLSLKLKKGKYVLICNIPGHYGSGMFTKFRVR